MEKYFGNVSNKIYQYILDLGWKQDGLDYLNTNCNNDYSNTTFINDLWYVAPASEIIIKVSVLLPIVLWGIFGNLSLLYIIIKNPQLRSPTNMLIGNMAVADFITLLIHPWMFLAYDIFQNFPLGKIGCRMEGGLECAVLLASVVNLLAISYDRLNAIALPQEKRLRKNGAKIIMVMAWTSGFLFATPLFVFRTYKERQWANFLEKYCTENVAITNIYWHVVIIMIVWLPLGTMLVCYVTLFVKLDRYERVLLQHVKTLNVNYKKKVAKMMFVVVVTFVICRLPFTALIFYRNELMKRNHISNSKPVQNQVNGVYYGLWLVSRILIFSNAAINPVIYGLTNERFRQAFKSATISKWIFAFNTSPTSELKVDKKPKKCNNAVIRDKRIFFIFKGTGDKNARGDETVFTDSASNVPIVK